MNIEELFHSIYLGDRFCKAVSIDSLKRKVSFQINLISRLKPGTKTWNYYSGGDIADGWLVFTDVGKVIFDPPGLLLNDEIELVSVRPRDPSRPQSNYIFELTIGSGDDTGKITAVTVHIEAQGFHLEDPTKPGTEIK